MSNTDTQTHTAKCTRCHRTLTSPASIARGAGSRCAAIDAALTGLKAEQADKARELIADGGIAKIRDGIYRVSSSSGDAEYMTSVKGVCNCPAGLRSRHCYHVAAVRLVARPRLRATASLFILAA